MKTYTTEITTNYVGTPAETHKLGQRTVKSPYDLAHLKDDVWTIMRALAIFKGWRCDNEGSMYIAYPRDPDDDSCVFAKIYDDETGEAIDLD